MTDGATSLPAPLHAAPGILYSVLCNLYSVLPRRTLTSNAPLSAMFRLFLLLAVVTALAAEPAGEFRGSPERPFAILTRPVPEASIWSRSPSGPRISTPSRP
jgi:hypothetical protein